MLFHELHFVQRMIFLQQLKVVRLEFHVKYL